jgi:hypothetical protein
MTLFQTIEIPVFDRHSGMEVWLMSMLVIIQIDSTQPRDITLLSYATLRQTPGMYTGRGLTSHLLPVPLCPFTRTSLPL